jgi:tetraacyldisaccharide 4'-kinase
MVTNGHGEAAIADRIALELHALSANAELDHLALVGDSVSERMRDVGPRRRLPSGGLLAMGNVRNIAHDVAAGLLVLTFAQYRFLRRVRGSYDVAVAIGDAYALAMTLLARAPTVFVGTAKSVSVARYGPFEERLLRRTAACFVRDDATARALRERGVHVDPATNVIADLAATPTDDSNAALATDGFTPSLALFPGSRESAYDDAGFLLDVTREVAAAQPGLGAVLSIARGLHVERFIAVAKRNGWEVQLTGEESMPFVARRNGREIVRAWRGAIAPLLARVTLVLGQAGTANEAAAAAGVPVIAFERDRNREARWYRQRQRGLLGGAMAVLPSDLIEATAGVCAILADPEQRKRMSEAGRARMGAPGGANAIARRIASLVPNA